MHKDRGDLKISNIKICIILGGAFQEKFQNHKSYKKCYIICVIIKKGEIVNLKISIPINWLINPKTFM